MPTIKNISKQVVLLRFNSGIEVNIGLGESLDVADSEIRSNPVIAKLEKLKLISVSHSPIDAPTVDPNAATEPPIDVLTADSNTETWSVDNNSNNKKDTSKPTKSGGHKS